MFGLGDIKITPSTHYLAELKKVVLDFFKHTKARVYLFGSRSQGKNHVNSDVDLAILPDPDVRNDQITLLREKIENSHIPYKVDILNMNEVSEDFSREIFKDAIVWKE